MTGRSWLETATERLLSSGAPDAALDAQWMLCDALEVERPKLRALLDEELGGRQLRTLDGWLELRAQGLPLQYVQRRAYFMGHTFAVDERVLIPRQDTEVLCEAALARMGAGARVLDLCTGSGALAVALKLRRPDACVTASDISAGALEVARINAQAHQVQIEFRQGDLFSAVPEEVFDVIVCNPPYIRDDEMDALQPEVKREPELALRGGADGLALYRRIASQLFAHLAPGGVALFEVGIHQAEPVRQLLLMAHGAGQTEVIKDLNGIERVVIIEQFALKTNPI